MLTIGLSTLAPSRRRQVIGYASGSLSSRIEVIYGVTAVVALMLTLISLSVDTTDARNGECLPQDADVQHGTNAIETQKGYFTSITGMSRPVAKAFAVQSLAYFAFMLLFVYGSVWAGRDVFQGAGDAPLSSNMRMRFDAGVQAANQGFLLMAVCSIALSLSLPSLLRTFGFRPCWSLGLFTLGVAMMMTKLVTSAIGVYLIFAAISIPIACSFTIPWTLVSISLRDQGITDTGRHMATFNLSQSLPCIVAVLLGSLVLNLKGETISNVLVVGGFVAMIASGLVWWCDDPPETGTEEYTM